MGATGHGLIYPASAGTVDPRLDFQTLATSTETALVAYETYSSWTPSFVAGPTTIGAGGVSQGFYRRLGNWVSAQFYIELGTGFAFTSTFFDLTLPVAAYATWGAAAGTVSTIGRWEARDDSVPRHYAGSISVSVAGGTRCSFGGAYDGTAPRERLANTGTFTWAAGDIFTGAFSYRAA